MIVVWIGGQQPGVVLDGRFCAGFCGRLDAFDTVALFNFKISQPVYGFRLDGRCGCLLDVFAVAFHGLVQAVLDFFILYRNVDLVEAGQGVFIPDSFCLAGSRQYDRDQHSGAQCRSHSCA